MRAVKPGEELIVLYDLPPEAAQKIKNILFEYDKKLNAIAFGLDGKILSMFHSLISDTHCKFLVISNEKFTKEEGEGND